MHAILQDLSLPPLLNAMEINVHEAWTRFGRGCGAEVHEEPDWLWFFSGLPFHLANGIVNAQLRVERLEEVLDKQVADLTARSVPMAWLIGPSTRPSNLGDLLQARGWALGDEAPGMAADLYALNEHSSAPEHLTIERVSHTDALMTWLRIMTVGSEIPEEGLAFLLDLAAKHGFREDTAVHYYLGFLDKKAVATSLLYLSGGVAGIYNVATLPEARRQGIGTALTIAPLLDARTQGYRIGTLQSTPMGLNLYRYLGFREYCTFQAYFWNGESAR